MQLRLIEQDDAIFWTTQYKIERNVHHLPLARTQCLDRQFASLRFVIDLLIACVDLDKFLWSEQLPESILKVFEDVWDGDGIDVAPAL